MPKIEMHRDHGLSPDEARSRVERIAAELESKYGLKGSFQGERYVFQRTGVKGAVEFPPGRVSVSVDLSLVLAGLRSRVEAKLKEGLEREFA
jgi:putative polyhydroxyalkanoate system protein